jgi:hypothetical protein
MFASYGVYSLAKNKKYLAIAIIFLIIPSLMISNQLFWRADSSPPVVEEFHKFFGKNNIKGTVLTTDPTPVAFSDIKMLQFYSVVPSSIKLYMHQKDQADYVLFTENYTPCYNEQCKKEKQAFLDAIESENAILFDKTYNGFRYMIFKKES